MVIADYIEVTKTEVSITFEGDGGWMEGEGRGGAHSKIFRPLNDAFIQPNKTICDYIQLLSAGAISGRKKCTLRIVIKIKKETGKTPFDRCPSEQRSAGNNIIAVGLDLDTHC